MLRALKSILVAGCVFTTVINGVVIYDAVNSIAHASAWDGPGDHTYDDMGSSNGGVILALIVFAFAVYGFYKFATRND